MNYPETLDYLYHRLPMFSRIGEAAIKKDLANTLALCNTIGNPQHKFKSIHIAGTNGKGSTSHMLAAILQQSGYKTGLYTSPHLKDFRERIRINGQMIPEETVVKFTEQIQVQIEQLSPSFFEVTVAMAFDFFAENQVDIAVIETGLGGRLDSTNIITPEVSVITNIGMDHMNILGNTIESIAYEKAGIIKKAVPVVIGETLSTTEQIFRSTARVMNAPIRFADEGLKVITASFEGRLLNVRVLSSETGMHEYRLDLAGNYQQKNLLTVISAVEELRRIGWNIPDTAITNALMQVKELTGLRGRWEIVSQEPLVVLDVAHNVDGIKELVKQVHLISHNLLHIIIGMVKDKEIEKVLQQLPQDAVYYFTRAQIPRALSESDLAFQAGMAGLQGEVFPNVNEAFSRARSRANHDDLILICGSVFVVGEFDHKLH